MSWWSSRGASWGARPLGSGASRGLWVVVVVVVSRAPSLDSSLGSSLGLSSRGESDESRGGVATSERPRPVSHPPPRLPSPSIPSRPRHGSPPHVPRPNNTKIFNLNNRDYYLMRLPTSWIVRNVMFFFVCASHGGNSVTPIVGMIPLGNQIF